jgi:hypothetical protein
MKKKKSVRERERKTSSGVVGRKEEDKMEK